MLCILTDFWSLIHLSEDKWQKNHATSTRVTSCQYSDTSTISAFFRPKILLQTVAIQNPHNARGFNSTIIIKFELSFWCKNLIKTKLRIKKCILYYFSRCHSNYFSLVRKQIHPPLEYVNDRTSVANDLWPSLH